MIDVLVRLKFQWCLYYSMPRAPKNDNFIDQTFTLIANLLLTLLPTSYREKQAFTYYRDGVFCGAQAI